MSTLKKKNILITRSLQQAVELAASIEKLGWNCNTFPCINIKKLNPAHYKSHYDCCIVTSANAVHPFKTTAACWIAIGPATAAALEKHGINAIYPSEYIPIARADLLRAPPSEPEYHSPKSRILNGEWYSSEGVLQLPQLLNIAQKNIAIFTGVNPKPLLHDTLQQRGANVDLIYCYERSCPNYTDVEIIHITKQDFNCIVINSGETLRNLYTIFKNHLGWLTQQPVLVTSKNMRQQATAAGFTAIYQASNPSVAAICQALLAMDK